MPSSTHTHHTYHPPQHHTLTSSPRHWTHRQPLSLHISTFSSLHHSHTMSNTVSSLRSVPSPPRDAGMPLSSQVGNEGRCRVSVWVGDCTVDNQNIPSKCTPVPLSHGTNLHLLTSDLCCPQNLSCSWDNIWSCSTSTGQRCCHGDDCSLKHRGSS